MKAVLFILILFSIIQKDENEFENEFSYLVYYGDPVVLNYLPLIELPGDTTEIIFLNN